MLQIEKKSLTQRLMASPEFNIGLILKDNTDWKNNVWLNRLLTLLPGSPCSPFSPFTPPGRPWTHKHHLKQSPQARVD